MKSLHVSALAILVATTFLASAQSPNQKPSDRERLIGAWHLLRIESPGPNGNEADAPQPAGILIFARRPCVCAVDVSTISARPEQSVRSRRVRGVFRKL
jgi:hypothetical protein